LTLSLRNSDNAIVEMTSGNTPYLSMGSTMTILNRAQE